MYFDTNTSVLIIEDSSTVRQGLRAMLSMANITRSDAVSSASEGRQRLKAKRFDVVLCDYNLGEGMNGQELLEAMRRTGTLPLSTIWIMITGERKYERVVAAAEMAPDDYILKPFNSKVLLDRMSAAFKRKQFLFQAHSLLEAGKVDEAIDKLAELLEIAGSSAERIDASRLRAELLVSEGRQSEALHIYQELLTQRIIPWAKMGVARIYADQGLSGESSELLKEVIQDAPLYTDAYDLLAQNLIDDGQYKDAVDVLEKAVNISPRNFHRLRSCGTAALRSGDPEKGAQYLQRAVEIGKHNNFFGPEILVDLLQAYSETGNTQSLDRLQAEISASMANTPGSEFVLAVCKALVALGLKRYDESLTLLKNASAFLLKPSVEFETVQRFLGAMVRLPVDMLDATLLAQWSEQITFRFAYSRHEQGLLLEIARNHESCRGLIDQAYHNLQEQNNNAVALATEGKTWEAGQMLYELASASLNERSGMNACAILLKLYEQQQEVEEVAKHLEQQIHSLLSWLPHQNERVKGFLSRLPSL